MTAMPDILYAPLDEVDRLAIDGTVHRGFADLPDLYSVVAAIVRKHLKAAAK